MVITYSRVKINRGIVAIPACSWSAEQRKWNLDLPCPSSHLRIWSRETGSAVPSRISLVVLYTRAESDAFLLTGFLPVSAAASIYSKRLTPSPQSRVYRVMQLLTDDLHCRESAGTGPVVLKIVPVTGAAFASP